MSRAVLWLLPTALSVSLPICAPAVVSPAMPQSGVKMAELWEPPRDLSNRDLFYGPWGPDHAPDPRAVYSFVAPKQHGTNPGVVVRDPAGREWHVKQPPPDTDQGAEGPIEVVVSRVLSAVGYHQPPVYFLPAFQMTDRSRTHTEPGGRFRLREKSLKDLGSWSWQQTPLVDTDPYQGLLVILMMFNSSDLKDANNVLYEVRRPQDDVRRWYVVRDIGTALGETGRLAPTRGDIDMFEKHPFITGLQDGFVQFTYHGWHQELFKRRITPGNVRWASELMAGLTDRQWADAFRAGGYDPGLAARFIRRLKEKIADGQRLGEQAQ